MYMALGTAVTTVIAYLTVETQTFQAVLNSAPPLIWLVFLAELLLVGALTIRISQLSLGAATAIFLAYAALNGFTLSSIALTYDIGTIVPAFLTAAGLYLAMSVVGTFTTIDLTRVGTFAIMGAIGLILAMVINLFVRSSGLDLIISLVGVAAFTALTASDTQKIVRWSSDPKTAPGGEALAGRISVLGALTLYLDFLNLFLFLLRIFDRKS
jgi:FtsH-binding integral membrane protein